MRVAALKDQVAAGITTPTADGRTPAQTLREVGDVVERLVAAQEALLHGELLPALSGKGIELVRYADLDEVERKFVAEVFEHRMFPVLTPLAVDPAHPFPYISNLALSLAVQVRDPATDERRFARVKVPDVFPRLVELPSGGRFVPAEEVVAAHVGRLFVGMEIERCSAFRVTRNADLTLQDEEEADDLLALVEMELRRRRFGRAVRLEAEEGTSPEILDLLVRELELDPDDVGSHRGPLGLTCLFQLHEIDRPDLKDEPWPAVTAGRIQVAEEAERSIFSVIQERDLLVHHPYESFASSVEQFLEEAAVDPKVQSIKMTLYRTSGDSPIAAGLMRAAELGKQVAVLVELKARFDEANNLAWARRLERSGVHVVYGVVGLKTHAKCLLVVREDDDGLRRYVHLGTGNYNSKTSRLYEDLGYLSCDEAIGADATELFNHLTGYSRSDTYRKLVVAPRDLRPRILELIENEARLGEQGAITMKLNSIADPEMVEALYAASQAGTRVELIVRGICCVRPEVEGMSERIRVRSILGRYLEHSRIYRFANGEGVGSPLFLIGSADLMPRNLDRRVESLVPIVHPKHQGWLDTTLAFLLADDIVRFELGADAEWRRAGPDGFEPHAQTRIHEWVSRTQAPRVRAPE